MVALENFLVRRSELGFDTENLPLFIHSDGSNLSKKEFNATLKELLSVFPELATSSIDYWAGHSFRAGLSTLLQGLGFSEAEIKSWGRWRSSAYLLYLKDMQARRNTKAKLTKTFADILRNL